MPKITLHQQSGQGLIETLVVVLLVAVSVVAFFQFQQYLSYSSDLRNQQGDAILIGTSQIESLRNFSVLNTTTGYTAYQDIVSGSSNVTAGNTTYRLSWAVTTNTAPTYKTINLTVAWTDRYGTTRSISFVTNVAGLDPATPATFM